MLSMVYYIFPWHGGEVRMIYYFFNINNWDVYFLKLSIMGLNGTMT